MYVDGEGVKPSKKKTRSGSLPLPEERGKDTRQGISHFAPDDLSGQRHRTDSSLPETAASVNRPAPDFSTAAEPPGTLWCMGKRLVSMYVGTLLPDMAFSAKKPPVASSVSRVCRNEDTGRRITISHPAGKQGASHMTASSLPDSAAPVNRPAPTDPGVCADRTHG